MAVKLPSMVWSLPKHASKRIARAITDLDPPEFFSFNVFIFLQTRQTTGNRAQRASGTWIRTTPLKHGNAPCVQEHTQRDQTPSFGDVLTESAKDVKYATNVTTASQSKGVNAF